MRILWIWDEKLGGKIRKIGRKTRVSASVKLKSTEWKFNFGNLWKLAEKTKIAT